MPGHYDSVTGAITQIGGYPETYNNISGFRKASSVVKEANGWYLVRYENTDFNPETEKRDNPQPTWDAINSEIVISYSITTKTAQEFDDDLQIEKDRVSALISRYRDGKVISGFTSDGIVYDSDQGSLFKINSAVNGALATGNTFTINWTAKDNSVVVLDYNGVLDLAKDLTAHGDSLHQEARGWKNTIEAATTYQELRDFLSTWEGS